VVVDCVLLPLEDRLRPDERRLAIVCEIPSSANIDACVSASREQRLLPRRRQLADGSVVRGEIRLRWNIRQA
jgi:hypothetical protein